MGNLYPEWYCMISTRIKHMKTRDKEPKLQPYWVWIKYDLKYKRIYAKNRKEVRSSYDDRPFYGDYMYNNKMKVNSRIKKKKFYNQFSWHYN